MRQTVTQDDDRAGYAIQDALGVTVALPFVGLVVTDDDGPDQMLAAAIVLNNFDRQNIDLTISVEKSISPRAIREVARYVFGRLGVRRVTCVTLASNHRAINSLRRMRFECEGILRQRFPQGDGLIFSLLVSEQKFVRLSDGIDPQRPGPLRDRSGPNAKQSADCSVPAVA